MTRSASHPQPRVRAWSLWPVVQSILVTPFKKLQNKSKLVDDFLFDFSPFFMLKTFDPWDPYEHWTDKNGFANLFIFEKIFDCKVRKSHVRVVVDATFSLLPEVFIFLNYCYWVCKHTQKHFFCLIVPLKSVRSLQSFSESVRPVIVNNYADTMSV